MTNVIDTQQVASTEQERAATGMFRKILVAIDRSEIADTVFQYAVTLSQRYQSPLMIFTGLSDGVIGSTEATSSLIGVGLYGIDSSAAIAIAEERWHTLVQETQTWLERYWEQATQAGVVAEFDQRRGEPGSAICDLARTWGADLIVLGRRGRSGLSELLMGSVSNYVMHHAPCSVLVVQGPKA